MSPEVHVLHIEMRKDNLEIVYPPIKRITANPGTIGFASAAIVPVDHLKIFGQDIHNIIKLIVQQPKAAA
jgi:hypothetical protein